MRIFFTEHRRKTASETFNDFFVNIIPNLKTLAKENHEVDLGNDDEPILNIDKYKNHQNIKST